MTGTQQPSHEVLATPGAAAALDFTIDELGRLRTFVAQAASHTPLSEERASDLVLAVNELATNSICHGGGQGTLRIWREGETVLCEVRDRGHIVDAAGQLEAERPSPEAMSGRGLWLVDQLCDRVQIRSSREGSAVRLEMRLP